MLSIQKVVMIILLSTFPAAVFFFYTWQKTDDLKPAPKEIASKVSDETRYEQLQEGVDSKVQQITEIDVKILEAQGEVMKYKEQKNVVIEDLEKLMKVIKPIVDGARASNADGTQLQR
jgi:hypothetical protein